MKKQRAGAEIFGVCVKSFLVLLGFSYIESPTCGFVSVQDKSQRDAKEPIPCDEGGTLRRDGGGTCVPQGWLKCHRAR